MSEGCTRWVGCDDRDKKMCCVDGSMSASVLHVEYFKTVADAEYS